MWESNRMKVIRYSVQDGITSKRELSKSHDSKTQMAKANNMLFLPLVGKLHISLISHCQMFDCPLGKTSSNSVQYDFLDIKP